MPSMGLWVSVMNHAPESTASGESDEVLFRRFGATGDRAAMDALFARHVHPAYRLALSISGNSADAEEIVQSAFVQILARQDHNLRPDQNNLRGWIMTIVANAARMKLRSDTSRRAREQESAGARTPAGATDPERAEMVQAACRGVQALPALYRTPIVMHHLDGFSIADISAVLNIPEKTIRSQISRGLEQLRDALTAAGFSAAVAGLPELLSQVPLENAPPKLLATLKSAQAAHAAKAAKAVSAVTAKGSAAKLVIGVLATLFLASFLVGRTNLMRRRVPHGGAPVPITAGGDAPASPSLGTADPFGKADARLNAILDTKIDKVWRRDLLVQALDQLKQVAGLKWAAPISARYPFVTFSARQTPVREVLAAFARETKVTFEVRADAVLVWKTLPAAQWDEFETKMRGADVNMRRETVCSLGAVADPRGCALLLSALKDPDAEVRKWAVFSLANFRDTLYYTGVPEGLAARLIAENPPAGEYRAAWLQLLGATRDPGAEKVLIGMLSGTDDAECEAAAEMLQHYDSPSAKAAMVPLIGNKNENVRYFAADYARMNPSDEALKKLLKLLDRSYFFTNEGAAIAAYPYEKIQTELQRILDKGSSAEKCNAATVLSFVRGPSRDLAYAALLELLNNSKDAKVSENATWAFANCDHPHAAKDLIRFIDAQPDSAARQSAFETLAAVRTDEAVTYVLDNYSRLAKTTTATHYFVRALGEIRDERTESMLLEMMKSTDPAQTQLAVQALEALRTPRSLDAVENALSHGDLSTRWNAAMTLSRHGNTRAVDALIGFLTEAPKNWMAPIAASSLRPYLSCTRLAEREKIITALEKFAARNRPPQAGNGDF